MSAGNSELGAREAGKRATRLALVRAALQEFAEHGFDAPSLDAICARAGYTRGAFYVHFDRREDLIAAAMEHALDAFVDAVVARGEADDDLESTVRRFIDSALDLPSSAPWRSLTGESGPDAGEFWTPPFHQVLQACERIPGVRAAFVAALARAGDRLAAGARRAQAVARVRGDIDPGRLADILILLALGVRTGIDLGLPMDLARARDAALTLLRN